MTVTTSTIGDFTTFTAHGDDIEACRAEVIRLAHAAVFGDGRTAEVRVGLVGKHGGAYITGAEASVTFT
jgi:hypothetical protein